MFKITFCKNTKKSFSNVSLKCLQNFKLNVYQSNKKNWDNSEEAKGQRLVSEDEEYF